MKSKVMHVLYVPSKYKSFGIFWSAAAALRYGDAHFKGLQMVALEVAKKK